MLTLDSYALYIAILVFYLMFAYFMYPETKNHTVEEVSIIFDSREGLNDALNKSALREIEHRGFETRTQPKDNESPFLTGVSSHRENIRIQ